MKDTELQHFVEATVNYFLQATGKPAELGVPYVLKGDETPSCQFTGIIGISGSRKGAIYVCCQRDFLVELGRIVTGIQDLPDEAVRDVTGELANTIAGNATRSFDRNFKISVPVIFEGEPKSVALKMQSPVFAIPVHWQNHKLHVYVGISD